jgi:hypothetical protein
LITITSELLELNYQLSIIKMHHNTYERFCGSWWGSIIGLTITHQADNLFNQPWLLARRQFAELLLEQKLNLINFTNVTDETNLFSSLAFTATENNSTQVNELKHDSIMLSLLPLIIFSSDEQKLSQEIKRKDNLKSANYFNNICFDQEVLIWSYLLNIVLNNRFNSLSQIWIIDEILNQYQMSVSPLTDKLKIVFQGIQQGHSLTQIVEQVSLPRHPGATAIALAWYCFATTPHDFKLAVKRSAGIELSQRGIITALTATLSGAYNGMKIISQDFPTEPEQEQHWHLEKLLLTKLFKFWLGVYIMEGNYESYNLKLEAITVPGLIQSRQNLKIISQSSY